MPNLSELLYFDGEISLQLIVWSLFIGVVVATIAGYLIKAKFGAFIRKLLENEINSPEKAVTLDELGLQKKLFIKLALKSHTNYKNMLVAITEDGRFFANNAYTDTPPTFKEFAAVKRKRAPSVIKETKTDEDSPAPLSELARVLEAKEKLVAEKANNTAQKTQNTDLIDTENAKNTENTVKCAEIKTDSETVAAEQAEENPNKETLPNAENTDIQRERVKFDISKAKYYIPPEIHDRAYSLYHTKSERSNSFIIAVILLIVLALIATFSGKLVSGFTDFIGGIKNPFSKPII